MKKLAIFVFLTIFSVSVLSTALAAANPNRVNGMIGGTFGVVLGGKIDSVMPVLQERQNWEEVDSGKNSRRLDYVVFRIYSGVDREDEKSFLAVTSNSSGIIVRIEHIVSLGNIKQVGPFAQNAEFALTRMHGDGMARRWRSKINNCPVTMRLFTFSDFDGDTIFSRPNTPYQVVVEHQFDSSQYGLGAFRNAYGVSLELQ